MSSESARTHRRGSQVLLDRSQGGRRHSPQAPEWNRGHACWGASPGGRYVTRAQVVDFCVSWPAVREWVAADGGHGRRGVRPFSCVKRGDCGKFEPGTRGFSFTKSTVQNFALARAGATADQRALGRRRKGHCRGKAPFPCAALEPARESPRREHRDERDDQWDSHVWSRGDLQWRKHVQSTPDHV